MSTLVIVPAYNEEASIVTTIEELTAVAPDFDYIIVNDGSRDKTSEICHSHGFHIIDQPVNLGLTGGFQTGMKYAWRKGYDSVVQLDADGQHRPEHLADLERCQEQTGADIVIGSRFVTKAKPHTLRMLGSNLISFIIKLTCGKTIKDPTSGMRLYNRRMIEQFATRTDLAPEPDTLAFLIKKKGAKVAECQVEMRERAAGESYLTLSKSVSYMANACVSILFAMWFKH
ncbi:glycosyltransferase family 2 protein [Collinsella sp. An2]|uniref:glycosyltransferase family 2 protein n=1 Tax=Collinsella sp. An2 TaxID=1965585 RepID=UPI000B3765C5|nr:glycosyltransferase family 2 protein [Collinsella sp. An2]OUP10059.1 glycosyl transferase family 2 [Collinsella sp. An2]